MCYYKFSEYLKQKFGTRVHKVSVDAGFSCPNKDGKISARGCIFCDNRGFSFNTRLPVRPLEVQIEEGMKAGRRRFKAERFIVYFQAYTNTYAPLPVLKAKYDLIKEYPEVVGISIATRPDCVNDSVLDLASSYAGRYEVWMEYGLQSIHKETLNFVNRGHYYDDFLKTVELTRKKGSIKICAHLIVGLPYRWGERETTEIILETAKEMGRLNLDGIKIHPLHVVKGTELEALFLKGGYQPMELEEYVDLATEFLEYLSANTVIQRISADCPKEWLVAPLWISDKHRVLRRIEERMTQKRSSGTASAFPEALLPNSQAPL
jgi:radical SAM protein (TIGR01212 family)